MHSIVADITPRRGLHLDNRWSVSKAAATTGCCRPGLERGRDLDSHALCFHAILVPYHGFAPLVMRPSLRRLKGFLFHDYLLRETIASAVCRLNHIDTYWQLICQQRCRAIA